MIRYRSRNTWLNYEGLELLAPGGTFADTGSVFAASRRYGTQAVPAIGASVPILDNYGNEQGSITLSVAEDFNSVEAAIQRAQYIEMHLSDHPLGRLVMTFGERQFCRHAGISDFASSLVFPPRGIRMIFSYTFIYQ